MQIVAGGNVDADAGRIEDNGHINPFTPGHLRRSSLGRSAAGFYIHITGDIYDLKFRFIESFSQAVNVGRLYGREVAAPRLDAVDLNLSTTVAANSGRDIFPALAITLRNG